MGVLFTRCQAVEFVIFLITLIVHPVLMRTVWRLFKNFDQLHSVPKFPFWEESIMGAHKLIG